MKKTLRIDGLSCANCASKIETEVGALEGVKSANLNFVMQKFVIEAEDDKMEGVLEKASAIATKFHPESTLTPVK